MSAAIIPFPQARRRRFIERTAARLAAMPDPTFRKMLTAALTQQAAVMARRGIDAGVIERERRALQAAIEGELWRQVLTPDGGVA